MQAVSNWLSTNYIELLGFVSGIAYLILSIKQKLGMWPLGIIMSLFYIWIFYVEKFYADASLQIYYVLISIYGWVLWQKGTSHKAGLKVTSATKKLRLILLGITTFLWLILGYLLSKTDAPLPFWDAFTTSVAIVATWMLSRKIIEHWLVWIFINPVAMGLYIYKEMYITALLYFILTVLAFQGYRQWKNGLEKQSI